MVLKESANLSQRRSGSLLAESRESAKCIALFGTLPRVLKGLFREMKQYEPNAHSNDLRKYRGRFCRCVREFEGIDREEFSERLNANLAVQSPVERFLGIKSKYPFTAHFIAEFEEDTTSILDFVEHGFLFGVGFPTLKFVEVIVQTFGAEKEFADFGALYSDAVIRSFERESSRRFERPQLQEPRKTHLKLMRES